MLHGPNIQRSTAHAIKNWVLIFFFHRAMKKDKTKDAIPYSRKKVLYLILVWKFNKFESIQKFVFLSNAQVDMRKKNLIWLPELHMTWTAAVSQDENGRPLISKLFWLLQKLPFYIQIRIFQYQCTLKMMSIHLSCCWMRTYEQITTIYVL